MPGDFPSTDSERRTQRTMIVAKHPLAIRWFHWINFPVIMIMSWSGLLIYWANDVYKVNLGGRELFKFFPGWFYAPVFKGFSVHPAGEGEQALFTLDHRLSEGMAWHFLFFWIFAINGIAYVAYLLISGQWKFLFPTRATFGEAFQVVLHDLHIRKKPLPKKKFNGAQQVAYTGVIVMGLLMVLTGLCMFKPVQFTYLTHLFGSYQNARLIHFVVTILFVLFFVVHVAQVIRAGWNNFRGMITGKEVVVEEVALGQ